MSFASIAKRALAALTAGAALVSLAACGSQHAGSGDAGADKLEVVASINQWGSVAQALGGDLVDVTAIMTSTNVEAHDYEPTTGDIAAFSKADVAVVNGADYDPWASKAADGTKATLVDAAKAGGIKEGGNPHVWFSSKVRVATADAITAAYKKAMPEHQAQFDKLNKAWHEQSEALESKIKDASATLKGLPYAATESVAWYLADDLGMTDATPKGYATASANESEPSPADIKAFTDALASGSIKMLVFNSQESDSTTDYLTSAAKAADVPIVDLTEQMPKQYTDLLDWMTTLVGDFADAVR
ncbi:zinc ABC transporter substrate-binding protein [Bifidobacterium pullorum subsp. saeculare]|uniref:Zinc ABC transporter substrate-binding protein n=1 Tax=Bifidobacterium pullorum subsp. saeculare TaxID=78257 RepID=A0A939B955_9BIFI|nr:zinc ABC transporter substrate-binding protein [Bifidobacterium pullorum]MBM6699183.1 zinc ABC transporter substrate-binding protein [Bifidobacterium pullorum subsp. saeculare]